MHVENSGCNPISFRLFEISYQYACCIFAQKFAHSKFATLIFSPSAKLQLKYSLVLAAFFYVFANAWKSS